MSFKATAHFGVVLALSIALLCGASHPAPQPPPKLMLWSWFADDDLRFLDDRNVGVAYLALSLQLQGRTQVLPSPRAVPIRIPPNVYQMAVVRFDVGYDDQRPAFTAEQRELAVKMVAEIASISHAPAVQIDFDAPKSAWPFYRELLSEVRARLRPQVFLSITALTSWCGASQSWLRGVPVDEIVPMAFSMGQATPAITTMLQKGGQFPFPRCRSSIGVDLAYGTVHPRHGQRAYFFMGGKQWSSDLVSAAKASVQ